MFKQSHTRMCIGSGTKYNARDGSNSDSRITWLGSARRLPTFSFDRDPKKEKDPRPPSTFASVL